MTAPPARVYVDTSAYLCVLLGEAGSSELARSLRGAQLLSSVLLVLEANRNLIRLSREGVLPPRELQSCRERLEADLELFELREMTLDLCTGALMPVVSTPRTLDLAHLRTAVWFHRSAPLSRFVTLDRPQEVAARELGLPT